MKRDELIKYLDELLTPGKFRDYCPNGLQVEGRHEVRRVVAGVTASQALLDVAVERGADAVLVHHGYFWKSEDGRVVGIRKQRLGALLRHDINLITCRLMRIRWLETTRNWRNGLAGCQKVILANRISAGLDERLSRVIWRLWPTG